ncbi:glycosyltransferase [Alteromonas sp. AMM-1]|uniref:glycosyltransferase n=1 Tax=Alteromonas sp. AMM-1 TaxID=3394233 RepID=UPI0039A59687
MKTPIVSVVMPVFNAQYYLSAAIESVLQQTCEYFELICVDDGSTDDSLEIIRSFHDPRIRLVSENQLGLAAARNVGIHCARGQFIALIDPDDCYEPEKLLLHLKHLLSDPRIGVSYCPSLFIDQNGKKTGLGQYPRLHNVDTKQVMCRNPVGNCSAAVIRMAALESIQPFVAKHESGRFCYFDETLKQSEHNDFWMRISLNTDWRFEGISMPLTLYRVNQDGLSGDLEQNYSNWQSSMQRHLNSHPAQVKPWLSLAQAYQLRYLARRAVKSGDPFKAIGYVMRAVATNVRIVWEEPVKTLVTLATAILGLLPAPLYKQLEKAAIRLISKRSLSV